MQGMAPKQARQGAHDATNETVFFDGFKSVF
jgi:hypothetical protein